MKNGLPIVSPPEGQKIKTEVTEKVFHQIQYLCKEIPNQEWSGVLFYEVLGTIKDPSNMRVILRDILPLDKGSSAATSYDFDTRFVDYMMENEELEDYKIGHIHSHNNMGVFFSGTDLEELQDNAPNHNYYFSFIVNNKMDFQGKIATVLTAQLPTEEVTFEAKDEEGVLYATVKEPLKKEITRLLVYDCDIESAVAPSLTSSFLENVSKIIKKYSPVGTTKKVNEIVVTENDWGLSFQERNRRKEEVNKPKKSELEPTEEQLKDFLLDVLKIPANFKYFKEVFTLALHLKNIDRSSAEVASEIVEKYTELYEEFWKGVPGYRTEGMFDYVLDFVIEELEELTLTEKPLVKETFGDTVVSLIQFKNLSKNYGIRR